MTSDTAPLGCGFFDLLLLNSYQAYWLNFVYHIVAQPLEMKTEPKLYEFYGEIWVKCPNCFDRALITSNKEKMSPHFLGWHKPTLACGNCGFNLTRNESDRGRNVNWFGPWTGYVESSCKHCGNQIRHYTEPTRDKKATIDLECEVCHKTKCYDLEWTAGFTNGFDPYFGLELYFTKMIKGNLLWVLNIKHCDKLISYIGVNQRDDNDREKWSMITNLPKWMILSKNRSSVLKALKTLKVEMA